MKQKWTTLWCPLFRAHRDISIIDVNMDKQPSLSGHLKNCQISQYNNFVFCYNGLRLFRAYGIGEEFIQSNSMEDISNNMSVDSGYQVKSYPCMPSTQTVLKQKTSSHLLSCTDPDCVKQFKKQNQLLNHLVKGDHLYDSEDNDCLEDTSKRIWAEKCTSVRCNHQKNLNQTNSMFDSSSLFSEVGGYALRRRKRSTRFSYKVKEYVLKLFEAGETSGKKANPYTVAKNMRYGVDEEGRRLFTTSEWLSHQQIRGLFANFAMKNQQRGRKKKLKLEKVEEDCDDEDLQSAVCALIAEEQMDVVDSIVN